MFNMEEEVEKLPSAKQKPESEAEGSLSLSDEQKAKLSEAMSIMNALANECNCSVEDLINEGSDEEEEQESPEEEEAEPADDAAGTDDSSSESPESGKKLALYIAQLKAKRG